MKPINKYELIEAIILIVSLIFITIFMINFIMALAHGWTLETRYWLFLFFTLILIIVFAEMASYYIKGKYFEEGKKEKKKPFNKNMIALYGGILLGLSGGVTVVYLIILIPPEDIKNYYLIIIVSNILVYFGLFIFILGFYQQIIYSKRKQKNLCLYLQL
jgi:hypothetical protein